MTYTSNKANGNSFLVFARRLKLFATMCAHSDEKKQHTDNISRDYIVIFRIDSYRNRLKEG